MRSFADPDRAPGKGSQLEPDELIKILGMKPHPEGGHFSETFRDHNVVAQGPQNGRAHSTAIYYLLKAGERSHWHRVDAAEIWHWYAGDALQLSLAANEHAEPADLVLGPDIKNGERPQRVVPAGSWQAATPLGAWTLVGCTVAPGFEFDGFEMAPPGWEPGSLETDR